VEAIFHRSFSALSQYDQEFSLLLLVGSIL